MAENYQSWSTVSEDASSLQVTPFPPPLPPGVPSFSSENMVVLIYSSLERGNKLGKGALRPIVNYIVPPTALSWIFRSVA